MEVNVPEAKIHLSKLLEKVALGEEVVIVDAGKPIAPPRTAKLVFGSAKGEFTVPDNFTDPDPEIEDLFYNGPIEPE